MRKKERRISIKSEDKPIIEDIEIEKKKEEPSPVATKKKIAIKKDIMAGLDLKKSTKNKPKKKKLEFKPGEKEPIEEEVLTKKDKEDLNRISISSDFYSDNKSEQEEPEIVIDTPKLFNKKGFKKRRTFGKKKACTKKEKYEQEIVDRAIQEAGRKKYKIIRKESQNYVPLYKLNVIDKFRTAFRYLAEKSGRIQRREEEKRRREEIRKIGKRSNMLRTIKERTKPFLDNEVSEMRLQIDIAGDEDKEVLDTVLKNPYFDMFEMSTLKYNKNLDMFGLKNKVPVILDLKMKSGTRKLGG